MKGNHWLVNAGPGGAGACPVAAIERVTTPSAPRSMKMFACFRLWVFSESVAMTSKRAPGSMRSVEASALEQPQEVLTAAIVSGRVVRFRSANVWVNSTPPEPTTTSPKSWRRSPAIGPQRSQHVRPAPIAPRTASAATPRSPTRGDWGSDIGPMVPVSMVWGRRTRRLRSSESEPCCQTGSAGVEAEPSVDAATALRVRAFHESRTALAREHEAL